MGDPNGRSANFDLNPFNSPVTQGLGRVTQNGIQGGSTGLAPNNVGFDVTGNPASGVANNYENNYIQPGIAADQNAKQQAQNQQRQQQQDQTNLFNQNQTKNVADQANQTYLSGQAGIQKAQSDEDSFTQARNAARRANGRTLYGGWG